LPFSAILKKCSLLSICGGVQFSLVEEKTQIHYKYLGRDHQPSASKLTNVHTFRSVRAGFEPTLTGGERSWYETAVHIPQPDRVTDGQIKNYMPLMFDLYDSIKTLEYLPPNG
jgi:hypothetical protein